MTIARRSAGRANPDGDGAVREHERRLRGAHSPQPSASVAGRPCSARNCARVSRRPGPVGDHDDAPVEPGDEAPERAQGLGRAPVDADVGNVGRRERGRAVRRRARGAPLHVETGQVLQGDEEFLDGKVELVRRQERAVAVAAQQLPAALQVAPEALRAGRNVLVHHEGGARGQVVEERRGRLEEERQVALHARGRDAVGDVLVGAPLRGVALEALAEIGAEPGAPLLVQGELARRQQAHLRDRIDGALGIDVEGADRLDLLAQEVQAVGHGAAGREEVHEPAADAELARHHHLLHGRVARERELRLQGLEVEPRLLAQEEGARGEVAARRQALERRRHRDDPHVARPLGELVQGGEPLRHQVGVRRELVVGQDLPVGQAVDGERRVEPGDLVAQPLGVLRRLRDDEDGPRAPREARDPESVGRARAGDRGPCHLAYATTTGIFPIFARHSAGPVLWTALPPASTATVTGMSFTSNS